MMTGLAMLLLLSPSASAAVDGRSLFSTVLSPRIRAWAVNAKALAFLKGTVLGATSSRNSRWSWCEIAFAGC